MGSDTRLRVVIEAARLFHERGFSSTSVADVLEAADVHSGSLYHFFPSKVALLEAVLERHRERLEPSLLAPAERVADDPVGRVSALLGHYRRALEVSGCTRGCPVGQLALEIGPHEARARSLTARYFAEWAAGVSRWFEAAPDRLPIGHDPKALGRHVLGVMQGATMQAIAEGAISSFDSSVAELQSYLTLLSTSGSGAEDDVQKLPPSAGESGETLGGDWRSW
jgi:AcrR family transcriptional regulator